jgi:tRNA G10  N-methylase Trm11
MDGNEVYGGDISEESVNAAGYNLKTISKPFSIKKVDAKRTNWADNMFDIAISNLP